MVDAHVLKPDADYEKHSECPAEYRKQMLADDMIPEMLFDEMVRGEEQHEQYDDAEACKQHVHPLLVQEVDGVRSFTSFRMTGVFMMTVVMVCVVMFIGSAVLAGVGAVVMAGMCAVVVSELARGKGGYEYGKADEHGYAFPAVVAGDPRSGRG